MIQSWELAGSAKTIVYSTRVDILDLYGAKIRQQSRRQYENKTWEGKPEQSCDKNWKLLACRSCQRWGWKGIP